MSEIRSVWIVVPFSNNGSALSDALYEYSKLWNDRSLHFVIVSDGNDDSTCDKVMEMAHDLGKVRLLKNSRDRGRGSASLKGILYSVKMSKKGDAIAILGPEKRFEISELERMINALEHGKSDGILSRRYDWRKKPKTMMASDYFFSFAYNKIANLLFGLDYTDIQSPAKIFRREAIDKVANKIVIGGEGFDLNLAYEMKLAGVKLEEVYLRSEPGRRHVRYDIAMDTILDTFWYRLYRTDFYKSMRERMHDF